MKGNKFPTLNFKTNGLFYQMVSNFMVAVAASPAIFLKNNPMDFKPEQTIELTSLFYEGASIYPYQIYINALEGHTPLTHFRHSLCMMLANLAYESAKAQEYIPKPTPPEWELLRHIRHASSHNNQFNFLNHEPSSPAYWKNLIIDYTQKGKNNPLYGTACFGNFMEMGELLALLFDIEDNLK